MQNAIDSSACSNNKVIVKTWPHLRRGCAYLKLNQLPTFCCAMVKSLDRFVNRSQSDSANCHPSRLELSTQTCVCVCVCELRKLSVNLLNGNLQMLEENLSGLQDSRDGRKKRQIDFFCSNRVKTQSHRSLEYETYCISHCSIRMCCVN